MAAGLARASSQENVSTSLSTGITDVAVSMDVADASKIQSPGYLVIDRVDSSGTLKATSLWEFVKVTNIATNTLTITRGQGGSTQQSHSSGAVVESVITATLMEEYYNALNPEHTATGGHVITGVMTIARMNLASVATVAVLSSVNNNFINLALTSIASIAQMSVKSFAIPSVASIAIAEFNIGNSNGHTVITPGTSKVVKTSLARQGGNLTDWTIGGVTSYYENNVIIQCGVLASWTSNASVVFPLAFSNVPQVFIPNAIIADGTNMFLQYITGAITTTGFSIIRKYQALSGGTGWATGGQNTTEWVAIGRLD